MPNSRPARCAGNHQQSGIPFPSNWPHDVGDFEYVDRPQPWPHDACAGPGEPRPDCNTDEPPQMPPGFRSYIKADDEKGGA
jgi:hypothetical protein